MAPLSREELAHVRAALNPFRYECWPDFLNRVTQGLMSKEKDPWHPTAPYHHDWVHRFEDPSADTLLLAHRNSLKTSIVLGYITGQLEYRAGSRWIWITNTQDQAHKKADTEFNKLVERNPWLLQLNQEREEDQKTIKRFANGSSLTAGWLFGAIEGDRAHGLVVDDVLKERGDGAVEDIIAWLEGAAFGMMLDEAPLIIIGTRKGHEDAYAELAEHPRIHLIEYPANRDVWMQHYGDQDNAENRLAPARLYEEAPAPTGEGSAQMLAGFRDTAFLQQFADRQSPRIYHREYNLVVTEGQGDVFRRKHFDYYELDDADGEPVVRCQRRGEAIERRVRDLRKVSVLDSAGGSKDARGSRSAITTWLYEIEEDATGSPVINMWLWDVEIVEEDEEQAQEGDFATIEEAVRTVIRKHGTKVHIEDGGFGPALVSTLEAEGLPVEKITSSGYGPKEDRAEFLKARYTADRAWHPRPERCPWVEKFEQEMTSFPDGLHEDQVDSASWGAILLLQKAETPTPRVRRL